jgi:hypothetical protein
MQALNALGDMEDSILEICIDGSQIRNGGD